MTATVAVICIAVFAVAGLIFFVVSGEPSGRMKHRLNALEQEPDPHSEPADQPAPDIRREEQISGIGWLNRLMVRADLAPKMRLLLYQADVKTPPETLLSISAAGAAAFALIVWLRTRSVPAALLLSLCIVPAPLMYVLRKRSARFAKFEQQLPEALDMLVSALKVGHSLISGIGSIGKDATEPVAGEFRKLFEEQSFGLDLRTAMTNLTVRVPLQDVRILVAAALIQKESGGNLAEVLEKVAHTTRERFRLKKQIMVHTAQGRLTGWILSVLPVALGVGMYLVNPEGMSVLWSRPVGLKMLYTSVAMVVVGCLLIRKIVRIRV
jgi:tight adherence protein B